MHRLALNLLQAVRKLVCTDTQNVCSLCQFEYLTHAYKEVFVIPKIGLSQLFGASTDLDALGQNQDLASTLADVTAAAESNGVFSALLRELAPINSIPSAGPIASTKDGNGSEVDSDVQIQLGSQAAASHSLGGNIAPAISPGNADETSNLIARSNDVVKTSLQRNSAFVPLGTLQGRAASIGSAALANRLEVQESLPAAEPIGDANNALAIGLDPASPAEVEQSPKSEEGASTGRTTTQRFEQNSATEIRPPTQAENSSQFDHRKRNQPAAQSGSDSVEIETPSGDVQVPSANVEVDESSKRNDGYRELASEETQQASSTDRTKSTEPKINSSPLDDADVSSRQGNHQLESADVSDSESINVSELHSGSRQRDDADGLRMMKANEPSPSRLPAGRSIQQASSGMPNSTEASSERLDIENSLDTASSSPGRTLGDATSENSVDTNQVRNVQPTSQAESVKQPLDTSNVNSERSTLNPGTAATKDSYVRAPYDKGQSSATSDKADMVATDLENSVIDQARQTIVGRVDSNLEPPAAPVLEQLASTVRRAVVGSAIRTDRTRIASESSRTKESSAAPASNPSEKLAVRVAVERNPASQIAVNNSIDFVTENSIETEVDSFRNDPTGIDSIEIDPTKIDTVEIDAAEIDAAEIESTKQIDPGSGGLDDVNTGEGTIGQFEESQLGRVAIDKPSIAATADVSADSAQRLAHTAGAENITATNESNAPLDRSSATPTRESSDSNGLRFASESLQHVDQLRQQAVQALRQVVESSNAGNTLLTVRINPEELGTLAIHLEKSADSMNAKIVATEAATGELLMANLDRLQESLQSLGYEDLQVEIQHEEKSSGSNDLESDNEGTNLTSQKRDRESNDSENQNQGMGRRSFGRERTSASSQTELNQSSQLTSGQPTSSINFIA